MSTKLIVVEGLPGSGKTTTAKMVNDILHEKGFNSELFSEGNLNHPADFEGTAYFPKKDFGMLKMLYPNSSDIIDKLKIEYSDGYLLQYKKASEELQINFEQGLLKELLKNDIYELPLDIHQELIIKRWQDFVNEYSVKDKIIIFECCFIQNPVTVTMIRNDSLKEETISYINNLYQTIIPMEPILLYVDQKAIHLSFNKIADERPKEWLDGFIDYYTNQGYGLYHSLDGIKGTIEILKERSKLEREIFDFLKLKKYKIDNSSFNADLLREKVKNVINDNF